MEERDHYAEVRSTLEDWVAETGISHEELAEQMEDIVGDLEYEGE